MVLFKNNSFNIPFPDRSKDFYICSVGYDDFTKVEAYKKKRVYINYSIHYVISGKGTLTINSKTHHIKGGELFLLPPQAELLYYPDEEDPWNYFWFDFNGEKTSFYLEAMGFSVENPVVKAPNSVNFLSFINSLNELENINSNKYFLVLSLFYRLMFALSNNSYNQGSFDAKKIIDSNFSNPNFDIENLCKAINISHSHLCKIFKEAYGITVKRYLIKKRLELAMKLLKETNLSIKTVALSCGYNDEIHFMKTFKNEFSITPKNFRNKQTKAP